MKRVRNMLPGTEIVEKYLPDFKKLKFEPGEKAVYSNLNYMVLGAIIEAVSGQPYEAYINANILERTGMSQTDFVYNPAMGEHEAFGTLDVARFMLAYLNHGTLDGNLMLTPESVSMLTDTPPIDGHGLGWSVGKANDTLYLEHAGGGPGFATIMRLYPERGTGFAILANGTDLDRDGLMDLLATMEW